MTWKMKVQIPFKTLLKHTSLTKIQMMKERDGTEREREREREREKGDYDLRATLVWQ